MIPVDQTKLYLPGKQSGNCLPAALASILELSLSNVPAFEDVPDRIWFRSIVSWLRDLGFQLLAWEQEIHFEGYYIAHGRTVRDTNHSVVYRGGKLAHDPHPSRAGLAEITSVWAFLPHDPAVEQWNAAPEKE